MNFPNIHESWFKILEKEFNSPYYMEIKKAIVNDINL
jgi:hypothetical protein